MSRRAAFWRSVSCGSAPMTARVSSGRRACRGVAVALVEDPGPHVERLGGDLEALGELLEDLGAGLLQAPLDLRQVGVGHAGELGELAQREPGGLTLLTQVVTQVVAAQRPQRNSAHAPSLLALVSRMQTQGSVFPITRQTPGPESGGLRAGSAAVLDAEQRAGVRGRHRRALHHLGEVGRPLDELGVVLDRYAAGEDHVVLHPHPQVAAGRQRRGRDGQVACGRSRSPTTR